MFKQQASFNYQKKIFNNKLHFIIKPKTQINKKMSVNKNDKYQNFVAGLVAGFVSVSLCNPLDVTRTRLNIMNSPSHKPHKYLGFRHTMATIYKQEGIRGFYKGYRTNVIAIPTFHALFFPIYEYSKKMFENKGYNKFLQYFLSTAAAGSICNIITNPIWVIRTRVMVQDLHPFQRQYATPSPMKIMRQMIRQEGLGSLFKGLSASLMSVSNAVIYFVVYETLKQALKIDSQGFNSYNIFIASTISKILSSSATYPLVVIRTVLHDHKHQHNGFLVDKKLSFLDVYRHIRKQNGLYGFYSGLKPDLMRLIPSNAILFISYEYARRFWQIHFPDENKKIE